MIELRDKTFDEFIEAGTSLIMFGTSWCKACIPGARRLEKFGEDHQIRTAKVDLQKCPKVMNRYLYTKIPFFILFRDGRVIVRHQGNDISGFERYAERHIAGGENDPDPP